MVNLLKQGEMTDAGTISRQNLSRTVIGMAHFAGTGPMGETRGTCLNFAHNSTGKKIICHKYRMMTKDGAKAVPSSSMACRYWTSKNP